MRLNVDEVMARADFLYSEMRTAEGRPQRGYGIESSQIKALAQALVEMINPVLENIENEATRNI